MRTAHQWPGRPPVGRWLGRLLPPAARGPAAAAGRAALFKPLETWRAPSTAIPQASAREHGLCSGCVQPPMLPALPVRPQDVAALPPASSPWCQQAWRALTGLLATGLMRGQTNHQMCCPHDILPCRSGGGPGGQCCQGDARHAAAAAAAAAVVPTDDSACSPPPVQAWPRRAPPRLPRPLPARRRPKRRGRQRWRPCARRWRSAAARSGAPTFYSHRVGSTPVAKGGAGGRAARSAGTAWGALMCHRVIRAVCQPSRRPPRRAASATAAAAACRRRRQTCRGFRFLPLALVLLAR